ncbi:phosphonate degradation HD-domain oxygenase [Novosphingobium sp.]|uniref:phosphonate degradation HD-domain oxygenase n=1 Tax=Novosphingobium sp. TaxID=1874826 RepID=UPI0038B96FBC
MDSKRIDDVMAPIIRFGALHYGEAITQYAHAVQCAWLAQREGCGPALVAAALLHDVGQFIDDAGNAAEGKGVDALHEEIGAAFLRPYFGPEVTEPMRLHVAAKRYLCAVEPGYREGLSAASELSLQLQGGAMDADEVAAFERDPFFADAIRLRRFDDAAKQPDLAVPPLESYRALLEGLLRPA